MSKRFWIFVDVDGKSIKDNFDFKQVKDILENAIASDSPHLQITKSKNGLTISGPSPKKDGTKH